MNIMGAIVAVAMAAVVLTSPNTVGLTQAWFTGFAGAISAAKG